MFCRSLAASPQQATSARIARGLGVCMFASILGCASLEPGDVEQTSQFNAVDTTIAVPSGGSNAPSGSGNATTSPNAAVTNPNKSTGGNANNSTSTPSASKNLGPQLTDRGQASSVAGMSLRWAYDTSRCMARASNTKAAGDRIVLAACASDARQAFFITPDKNISVGGNLCLGRASNTDEAQLTACGDGTVAQMTNDSYRMTLQDASSNLFIIAPSDAAATVGKPLTYQKITTVTTRYAWNFVGVGNVGGMLMPLNNVGTCLSRSGTSLAMASCNAADAQQRWRYHAGFLASDGGGCISCDKTTKACNVKTCDPNASRTDSEFAFTLGLGHWQFLGNTQGDSFDLSASDASDTPDVSNKKYFEWQLGATLQ